MCSPEVDISRLQRHILEEIIRLGECSFARKQIQVLSERASNKPQNGETSQGDGTIDERLRDRR